MIRRIPDQALLWMICLFASILTGNAGTQTNKARSQVWWSLRPVVRPALPDGPESNPIDRFINAELRNRGLKAVGAADKLSLLRRVYLDLIGIPPSPAEQEAFLADHSADAYEKVVDQLLANSLEADRFQITIHPRSRRQHDLRWFPDAPERLAAIGRLDCRTGER